MKLVKLTEKHYAVVADCGKKYEYISAAEAEEAINGYSVEKMAENYAKRYTDKNNYGYNGDSLCIEDRIEMEAYIEGFNAHKELVKGKVFTVDDMRKAWNAAFIDAMSLDEETYKPLFFEVFIQSLQQTEWPCKFENGKLVIL